MKKIVISVLIVLVVGGLWLGLKGRKENLMAPENFEMVKVQKGDVVYSVSASGKIQPINTVSVGTQVSGIIEEVLADYNDEVQKDQILARLDTSVLQENLNDAEAQLTLMQTKQKIEQLDYDRTKKLYDEKLIAKATLEESEVALETAKENSIRNSCDIHLQQCDILSYQPEENLFDTIVSNPPYIKESEKEQMEANVLDWEPHIALFVPDTDPILFYRTIAEKAVTMLKPQGKLYFEINRAHGNEVCKMLSTLGYTGILLKKDFAGNDRMIRAIKKQ
jgi:hypothetical protein